MLRIRILAAGLTMLAGSFAATASAAECQSSVPWMCAPGGGSNAAAAPVDDVSRSGTRRHRTASHHRGHRFAHHRSSHGRFRHILALDAEPTDTSSETELPPTPIVIPMQIPGRMSWAGEAGNQAGSVAAAFAAPQAAAKFDFLTEWRHTVGRITATHVWPEQTLNSFTEFPPP